MSNTITSLTKDGYGVAIIVFSVILCGLIYAESGEKGSAVVIGFALTMMVVMTIVGVLILARPGYRYRYKAWRR